VPTRYDIQVKIVAPSSVIKRADALRHRPAIVSAFRLASDATTSAAQTRDARRICFLHASLASVSPASVIFP